MEKMYYVMSKADKVAQINIFGEITSWPWLESDVSSYRLSHQLEQLQDVDEIHVHINSYGGEVAEGLAIYNALLNHPAKVKTYCDGFACSVASVIFMAGDERIMPESSMLMIHNAWNMVSGNAAELRKAADDLEKITQASVKAYASRTGMAEEEITELLDAETWMLPEEALERGFATSIKKVTQTYANQSAIGSMMALIKGKRQEPPARTPKEPNPTNPAPTATVPWDGFYSALMKL